MLENPKWAPQNRRVKEWDAQDRLLRAAKNELIEACANLRLLSDDECGVLQGLANKAVAEWSSRPRPEVTVERWLAPVVRGGESTVRLVPRADFERIDAQGPRVRRRGA